MSSSQNPTPSFIPVTVELVPSTDGTCFVTLPNDFDVTVSAPNTIIAYQMSSSTEASLKFVGITIAPEAGQGQFSTASISPDGRVMTLIDLCSCEETFKISFICTDADGKPHIFDPQVINRPA